jgi:hypothetical protein
MNTVNRFYVECCERAKAAVGSDGLRIIRRYRDQRIDVPVGPLCRLMGRCSSCGADALMVAIKVRVRFSGEAAPRCGGACLNGKTSCDCQCKGRCHGAGVCRCVSPVTSPGT